MYIISGRFNVLSFSHQVKATPAESITNIWLDIVHTLKGELDDIVEDTKYGSVRTLPLLSLQFLGVRKEVQPVWEILSSTIVYHIWKARCSLVFHQLKTSPVEVVSNLWLDIVHTLKGQLDGIVEDSHAKTDQSRETLKYCKVFTLREGCLLYIDKNKQTNIERLFVRPSVKPT